MIGERLKWLRGRFQQSLEAFGAEIGFDKSYLSRLESGKNCNPSEEFLEAVCGRYLVSRKWLESGEGDWSVVDATTKVDWATLVSHMSLTSKGMAWAESELGARKFVAHLLKGLSLKEIQDRAVTMANDPEIPNGAKPYWLKVLFGAISDPLVWGQVVNEALAEKRPAQELAGPPRKRRGRKPVGSGGPVATRVLPETEDQSIVALANSSSPKADK